MVLQTGFFIIYHSICYLPQILINAVLHTTIYIFKNYKEKIYIPDYSKQRFICICQLLYGTLHHFKENWMQTNVQCWKSRKVKNNIHESFCTNILRFRNNDAREVNQNTLLNVAFNIGYSLGNISLTFPSKLQENPEGMILEQCSLTQGFFLSSEVLISELQEKLNDKFLCYLHQNIGIQSAESYIVNVCAKMSKKK